MNGDEWRSGGAQFWAWLVSLFHRDVVDGRDVHVYLGLVLLSAAAGGTLAAMHLARLAPYAVFAVLGAGLFYMGARR